MIAPSPRRDGRARFLALPLAAASLLAAPLAGRAREAGEDTTAGRAGRGLHRAGLPDLRGAGTQRLDEGFFPTSRAGTSNSRCELVARIPR